MIHIRETFPDENTTALWVDGRLDRETLLLLKNIYHRHLKKGKRILLDFEGLLHLCKEGEDFLKEIRGRAILLNIPEFLKLQIANDKAED